MALEPSRVQLQGPGRIPSALVLDEAQTRDRDHAKKKQNAQAVDTVARSFRLVQLPLEQSHFRAFEPMSAAHARMLVTTLRAPWSELDSGRMAESYRSQATGATKKGYNKSHLKRLFPLRSQNEVT